MQRPATCALAAALILVASLVARPAAAVSVDVTYSLSGSLRATNLGWNVFRPISGSAIVRYQGSGMNTVSGPSGGLLGPAAFQSLDMDFIGSRSMYASVIWAGPVAVTAGPQSLGSATVMALALPQVSVGSALLPCVVGCSGEGPRPLRLTFVNPLTASGVSPTAVGHQIAFDLTDKVFALGADVTGTLTMQEVSRTAVVPEPGTGPLLALGVGSVLAAGARWRLARSRRS